MTLPSPVKIAVLLLACLLPFHAKAQEAPPTPDRWELAILTPGLRFDLTGTAPVEVAAQSGVGFDYLFGKLLFTTPQGAKLPWLGFSFFAQGGLDVSNLGESENAAIGVGCIILDSVTIGWYVDLAAGGPTGKASGLFTGNMTLGNTGPELFYSLPVSVL